MDELTQLIDRLRAVIAMHPEVAVAYLFGSVARGTARSDSDVDIGLVFRRGEGALEHHRLLADLTSRLEAVTAPREADVVALDESNPMFAHAVLRDARPICIADEARRVDFESEVTVRALDFRPTYELAARNAVSGFRAWLRSRRQP